MKNETIKWDIKEYEILDETEKQVKVRINALRPVKSRNGRVYTFNEMLESGRTLSRKPINVNHNDSRIVGNTDWAKANKQTQILEVTGIVNREPYVYMLKNHDAKIKGWSVQADFLHAKCTKCPSTFEGMAELKTHLIKEHHIQNIEYEPQDILFNALALVVDPEVPGIPGTSHVITETVGTRHFGSLEEMVNSFEAENNSWLLKKFSGTINEMEKEKLNNNPPNKPSGSGPPYQVKTELPIKEAEDEKPKTEKKQYGSMDECMKDGHSKEECMRMLGKEEEMPPKKEEPMMETKLTLKALEKLTVKEEEKFSMDACVASGKSEEECAAMAKEKREAKEYKQAATAKLNELIEAYNGIQIPVDDKSWSDRIDHLQRTVENRLTSVASDIVSATNKWNSEVAKVTEAIEAIPKEEWKQPLAEAVQSIQANITNESKKLTEALNAIPKDDLGWREIKPYDDAPLKATMETLGKTLTDNLAQTASKTQLTEVTSKLTEYATKLSALETENKTLREDHTKVKEMYEKNLAAFEKDIKEYYKPIEDRTKDLEKKLSETTVELDKTKKSLQETTTLAENTQDKIAPKFKGNAKTTVHSDSTPSSFNPYA